MSEEQNPEREGEEAAVPRIDIVGETVEDIAEAGARIILPNPKQPPRRAEAPHHPEQEEEYHIGGMRGPQDPGPWGSDEAIRNEPG
jgi:hypothetical protein